MILKEADEKKLLGVNPDLVGVVREAAEITDIYFIVAEGLRSKERQKKLLAEGKSKTMNSKHIVGKAVDLYPTDKTRTRIDWTNTAFKKLSDTMKHAAKNCGIEITWGGDWKTFIDKPHFEIK